MKYSEKLFNRYLDEIRSWKWYAIIGEAQSNINDDEFGEKRGSCYLGSILNLAPSGKYYTCWTTNQTVRDTIKDEAYFSALEQVAEENGMYITGGEGDGCDLYAEMFIEDDVAEEESIFDDETIEKENIEAQEAWDKQNIFDKD